MVGVTGIFQDPAGGAVVAVKVSCAMGVGADHDRHIVLPQQAKDFR